MRLVRNHAILLTWIPLEQMLAPIFDGYKVEGTAGAPDEFNLIDFYSATAYSLVD